MIAFKEQFIDSYTKKLNHKVCQELNDKLPNEDFLVNLIEKANSIVIDLLKFDKK